MSSLLLVLVVVLVLAGLIFGVIALLSGEDPGLGPVEPDGRALPLPASRSLAEADLKAVKFDTAIRGYRMTQVDRALRRTAYDIGYKDEMIAVLEAEVIALREGRTEDADLLRKAREAASDTTSAAGSPSPGPVDERRSTTADSAPAEEPDRSPADPADTARTGADAEPPTEAVGPTDDAPAEDAEDAEDAEPTEDAERTDEDTPAGKVTPTSESAATSEESDSSAEAERSARA